MSQIQIYNVSAGGGGPILTLTGNTGGAVPPTAGNINILGGPGVAVTGSPGTSTLTITVSGEFVWNVVTGTSATMDVNNGYITNNAGLVTLTLPVTSAVGDRVRVGGLGAGGWKVAQNAGQLIHVIGSDTTVGVGGSLASTTNHDTLELVCATANTTWLALSMMGNLTVV